MKPNNNILHHVVILLSLLWAQGCIDETRDVFTPQAPTEGEALFTISLPKKNGTGTRAMTPDQENHIAQITLLGFVDNSGTEELDFTYQVSASNIIPQTSSEPYKYNITATLPTGTYSSILLLANANSILTSAPSLLTKGTPKNDIQQGLIAQLADGTGWNANTTNPDPIPMHGQVSGGSGGITITPGQAPFTGVTMTRMLTRINFTNNEPNFTLQHIHLYNFRRDGLIIPGTTPPTLPATVRRHTQPLQYPHTANEIYTFEQDPSDGTENTNLPFILIGGDYNNTGTTTWYRIDLVNRIDDGTPQATNQFIPLIRNHGYNFVIDQVKGAGYDTPNDAASCLPFNTISRIFVFDDGDIENILFDGEYYLAISHETMEFDKNAQTQILHIETDNPLGWEITPNGGTGWLTIDKTQPGTNDNGNINVQVTGHNATAPRTAALNIKAGRLQYELPVTQTNLDGISLEITDPAGNPIHESLFRSNPRGNTIQHNPQFTVKWKGPECRVNITMLGNRLIKLPAGLADGTTLTTGQEQQTYTISPDAFTPDETDPETGTPFLEEGAAVTFTVTNGTDTEKRTIYIRHQCISILFDDLEPYCYMGHPYEFGVRSNTTWKITAATTEITNLFMDTSGQDFCGAVKDKTGGNDITTGTRFGIHVEPPTYQASSEHYGIGKAGRKMNITFTDQNGVCPPVTKTFTAITQDANSYRVRNGGGNYSGANGILGSWGSIAIPIRKLFWAWEKDLNTQLTPTASGPLNLTAEILWQTYDGLIQTGGAFEFRDYGGNGDYRDYCVKLWSDNRQATKDEHGNALIVIKNGNEILWSFHVWITNYFPENNMGSTYTNTQSQITPAPEIMDYNLGATISYTTFNPHQGGTPPQLSPDILGLYYQHGRKDPFPGPAHISNLVRDPGTSTVAYRMDNPANQATVVAPGGNRVLTTYQHVTQPNNLENSIKNPTIHYLGDASGVLDWYTNLNNRIHQNDYMWVDPQGRKALYDPCPPGWRTPLRGDKEFAGLNPYHQFINDYGSWINQNGRLYIPASGYIRNTATVTYPQLRNFRTVSYLYCAEIGTIRAYVVRGDSDGLETTIASNRSGSNPVRCIKDTYNWNTQHY